MAPRVTISMSVRNVAPYVGEAIESVLAQTLGDWELVITDDASTDETVAVIERYDDPRIRCVRNAENRGTYWNRNRALATARGRYFTTLDGDDVYRPDKLARQVEALADGGVACLCGVERFGAGSDTRGECHNTLMFDVALVDRIGFYDTARFGADTEYISRIARHHAVLSLKEPLVRYRERAGSLTTDPRTGTTSGTDGADIRAAYRERWGEWHARTDDLRLPFVQLERRFEAGHPRQLGGRPPIVASLAALPERRQSLEATVESLLRWADRVNVFVNGAMPDRLDVLDDPRVCVESSDVNHGDRMKFRWADELSDGYHFVCDDDLLYPVEYAELMIEKIERNGRRAIVGVHGSTLCEGFEDYYSDDRLIRTFRETKPHDVRVDFLGTGALAYHAGAVRVPFACFELGNMADAFLGVYAREQGIPLVCAASPGHMVSKHPAEQPRSIYQHCLEQTRSGLDMRDAVNAYLRERWV